MQVISKWIQDFAVQMSKYILLYRTGLVYVVSIGLMWGHKGRETMLCDMKMSTPAEQPTAITEALASDIPTWK